MKALLFLLFILFVSQLLCAQDVNFAWAKRIGGAIHDAGNSVVTDAAGYIYTTGSFSDSVYVSKSDAAGNFIWLKYMGGTVFGNGTSVAVDSAGNVYTTGGFYGTVDFDPGPGVYNLTADGIGSDIFVCKLDAAGNFIWAKQMGGIGDGDYGYGIALDAFGNIYTIGSFDSTKDFDPGPGIYDLTSAGGQDMFISKLSSAGNFVWAKQIGGGWISGGSSIALDTYGNIYTTGNFKDTIDFDPGPGIYNLTAAANAGDMFISKLDTAGNFMWVKQMKGTGNTSSNLNGCVPHSIVLDSFGNIFSTGVFDGTVDFDPGGSVSSLLTQSWNIFELKLNSAGNFVWALQTQGTGKTEGWSMALDTLGDTYITGDFRGTVDFDPAPIPTYYLTASGNSGDMFIAKYGTGGNFLWVKQIKGSGNEAVAYAIALDDFGNIYTTGAFDGTVDFDPGTGIYNLTSAGDYDIFIHKMKPCSNGSLINASACNSYTLNGQTYTASGVYTDSLKNAEGCDSVVVLVLTINGSSTTLRVTACDSYSWNGHIYSSTGTYLDTLRATNGCDSIITLDLFIKSKSLSKISAAICTGQNYSGYTTPGTYTDTLVAANGCDSIRTLDLTLKPGSFSTIDTAICPGQNYSGYTTTGIYTDSFTAANGCDSVRTLHLTIKNNCIPISIPNTFTPNNDSKNDIFKPTITQAIQQYSFFIFNRYGQLIFQTSDYATGWDGTYKGKEQPVDTYVYRIRFTNIFGYVSENNGTVLLLR